MLHFSSFNTRWLRKFDIEGKKCWFLSEAKFLTLYIYIADMPDVFDTTIYIYIYIYIYSCIYVYVYICMYIYVHVYVWIYMYIYTHINTHIHTHIVCVSYIHRSTPMYWALFYVSQILLFICIYSSKWLKWNTHDSL